jgi:uncharacterized hydrophobic protein (TIGR00271 family)
MIRVARGDGRQVLEVAQKHGGTHLTLVAGEGPEGEVDQVWLHVSNEQVEPLLGELQGIPDLHVVLVPRGVIALSPPAEEAPEQVREVGFVSPIEVFLGGLQSVGSWTGFLGYACSAGILAWIGIVTNTTFLLIASMLLSPFAGPAMNLAMATARGDRDLAGRSFIRYFASLAVAGSTSLLLSLAFRLEVPTEQMIRSSTVSGFAALLPMVAGASGALNLVQSERSSLVSGAATGVLVAASITPPVAVVGMASAIGRWDMVGSGIFLLVLQLASINLAGSLVFRLAGIGPKGTRYQRGRPGLTYAAWAGSAVVVVVLLTVQFGSGPELQRSTLEQRAIGPARQAIGKLPGVEVVEVRTRAPRVDGQNREAMLVIAYVRSVDESPSPEEELRKTIREAIQRAVSARMPGIEPLVDVVILEGMPGARR